MNGWIACSERMPDLDMKVLVYEGRTGVSTCVRRLWLFGEARIYHWSWGVENYQFPFGDPTHWQPLPEPPIAAPPDLHPQDVTQR